MPSAILTNSSSGTFTITLASLANGATRQSTMIVNSGNYPAAIIYLKVFSSGSAPTAATNWEVFLIRGNLDSSPTYRSDNAGASDAAIVYENMRHIGNIMVTNTVNKGFWGEFDTSVAGPLGPEWGIALRNSTGQAANATESNFVKTYNYYYPGIQ